MSGPKTLRFTAATARTSLTVTVEDSGDGLVVTLFGGDRPHVGTVILAQPRPSLSRPGGRSATSTCLPLLGHREEALARPVAERLAATLNVPVVVVAGVHLEGAQPAEIEAVLALGSQITEEILNAGVPTNVDSGGESHETQVPYDSRPDPDSERGGRGAGGRADQCQRDRHDQ